MTRRTALAAALLAALAACDATGPASGAGSAFAGAPASAPPARATAQSPDAAPQPAAAAKTGPCHAVETTPAVYEQVPGQVQVVQAEIAEDGTVVRPPIYRNAPVPKLVTPRGEIRFEVPCPSRMTPEFVASVQRALAARGDFAGPVTGALDDPTRAAIRAYQSARGLDSDRLSLETARALGLVEVKIGAAE